MLVRGMEFAQSFWKLPPNQVLFHFLNAVLNAQMQHNIGGLSVDQCLTPVTRMFWWSSFLYQRLHAAEIWEVTIAVL